MTACRIVPVGVPSWMNVTNSRTTATSGPVISLTMRTTASSGGSPGRQGLLDSEAGATPPSARRPDDQRLQCYISEMSEPTIYEWVQGRPAIARLIDSFYDRVERDDLLSPFFPGGVSAAHREHVTTWWCEVFGGPADYTERLGGYPAMVAHHRDLGITAEQRFRFASLMSLAADDAGLPDDPEFRAALVGYLEWGSRLAMHNSQPGADVPQQAPVPHWGWGAAPPYQP
jgi:hemoglobin